MICAAFLLSLVISCANSCICITTTTTTASATTTAAATTVATTTATTTTTVAAGRRKRSTDGKVKNNDKSELTVILSECAELEALEQMAFQVCPHGSDGFTWEEVMVCEVARFAEKNICIHHNFCFRVTFEI